MPVTGVGCCRNRGGRSVDTHRLNRRPPRRTRHRSVGCRSSRQKSRTHRRMPRSDAQGPSAAGNSRSPERLEGRSVAVADSSRTPVRSEGCRGRPGPRAAGCRLEAKEFEPPPATGRNSPELGPSHSVRRAGTNRRRATRRRMAQVLSDSWPWHATGSPTRRDRGWRVAPNTKRGCYQRMLGAGRSPSSGGSGRSIGTRASHLDLDEAIGPAAAA